MIRRHGNDRGAPGAGDRRLRRQAAPAASEGARIAGTKHLDDHSGPAPKIMAASSFEGETVVNLQGETLGEIEEIMLDVRAGASPMR